MTQASDITLFIDPFSNHFLRDALFDPKKNTFSADNTLAPWVYLRNWFEQRGIKVFTADRLVCGQRSNKRNLYISFGIWKNIRTLSHRADVTTSAFFAFEGPIVEPVLYYNLDWLQHYFKRLYSFSDSESLKPFLRRPLPLHHFCIPYHSNAVNETIWNGTNRKFLMMINGNKLPRLYWQELYTERLRAVEFFSRTGDIDLYGVGWNVPPYRLGKTWMPSTLQRVNRKLVQVWQRIRPDPLLEAARCAYRGTVRSKSEVLGQYTFALCFENMILKGWITEKIFDCFYAGAVPIYWGAPDIEKHVPADCFIDMRQFVSYQELSTYLKSLDQHDIQRYKENAKSFLTSEKFKPFSKEAFTDICRRIIAEDTGIQIN